MNGFLTALDSEYIIDGIKMELTPRQILDEATGAGVRDADVDAARLEPIVDESVDPSPDSVEFDSGRIQEYLRHVRKSAGLQRSIPAFFPVEATRAEIARTLTDTLWKDGHFRLDDIVLDIEWVWNTGPVGNMASFYKSVEAACSYLDALGIRLSGYRFTSTSGRCMINVSAGVEAIHSDDDSGPLDIAETIDRDILNVPDMNPALPQYELPFRTENPVLGDDVKCAKHVSADRADWLIYIPFDTCKLRLGGSLLAEAEGVSGGKAPETEDSDYFIDCFEVVREFVEDGVTVSGVSVGPGGLICALDSLAGDGGIDADMSCVMYSYCEKDMVKVLFSEVPGVIIEIKDGDFDYVDAEMLLQDVAYYPIGHPGKKGLGLTQNGSGSLAGIMQSLICQVGSAPEGED